MYILENMSINSIYLNIIEYLYDFDDIEYICMQIHRISNKPFSVNLPCMRKVFPCFTFSKRNKGNIKKE